MKRAGFLSWAQAALPTIARFWVGTILLVYAAPKFLGTQFKVLQSVYDTPLRDVTNFWLAWSFFGRSYEYQLMLGVAEASIAFLLLFRRTKTLGALCSLPISMNIMMMDYFFGVATGALVIASTLFVGALFVLLPDFKRLFSIVWDDRHSGSSRSVIAATVLYGIGVFAVMVSLIKLDSPADYLGKYAIEKYTVNGISKILRPGPYGESPTMYLGIRNMAVTRFDGETVTGTYFMDLSAREFEWNPEPGVSEKLVKGTYQVRGDTITFDGQRGNDHLEVFLRRDP